MANHSATVTKITKDPKNAAQVIITTSAGHSLWLQQSYVVKVLSANFLDDVRPTAIIGASLTYDMVSYKQGDAVMNGDKPVIKDNKPLLHTKDGVRSENIRFEEVQGNVTEYDKALMTANAIGSAQVKIASLFGNKAKKATVTTTEVVADTKPEVKPATEPTKEAVTEDAVS